MCKYKQSKEIQKAFKAQGVKLTLKEIDSRMNKLVVKFRVPVDEATRSVTNYFQKEKGVTISRSSPPADIVDLENEKWYTVKGRVVQLWDNTHNSIKQVGLIGDATGTVKFTSWASADAMELELDKSYKFSNVITSEFNGKMQIGINKKSEITETDPVEAKSSEDITFEGAVVSISNSSGLIKRCPECNCVLYKGMCSDHGKVEGVYDLRIIAVVDNGIDYVETVIGKDLTEKLTGMNLDAAIEMASIALDQGVVLGDYRRKLIGRYMTVTGSQPDRYLIAKEVQ